MTGVTPPPFFQKPRRPARTREAEDRFYRDHGHDFAIGLERVLAALRRLSKPIRPARTLPNNRSAIARAPIDKPEPAAFMIGRRSTETEPDGRPDARCRC